MPTTIPTKCLYFSHALRQGGPIYYESDRVVELEHKILCFRIPSEDELSFLRAARKPIITVVDDDYRAIILDSHLPLGYRFRMLKQYALRYRALKPLTTRWLVASQNLLPLYPQASRIDPFWNLGKTPKTATPDPRPFFHLGFLGTRSHLQDLISSLPALVSFLSSHPEVQLSLFLGKHCPRRLSALDNVKNHAPMAWRTYRKTLAQLNLDLSLLPSLDTQVNRCRSLNKLFEAFYAGGICLFEESYVHREFALHHHLGFSFTRNNLVSKLEHCLESPDLLRQRQTRGLTEALTLERSIAQQQRALLIDS